MVHSQLLCWQVQKLADRERLASWKELQRSTILVPFLSTTQIWKWCPPTLKPTIRLNSFLHLLKTFKIFLISSRIGSFVTIFNVHISLVVDYFRLKKNWTEEMDWYQHHCKDHPINLVEKYLQTLLVLQKPYSKV